MWLAANPSRLGVLLVLLLITFLPLNPLCGECQECCRFKTLLAECEHFMMLLITFLAPQSHN